MEHRPPLALFLNAQPSAVACHEFINLLTSQRLCLFMGNKYHKISALPILQGHFVGINEEMNVEVIKDMLHVFIYFV